MLTVRNRVILASWLVSLAVSAEHAMAQSPVRDDEFLQQAHTPFTAQ